MLYRIELTRSAARDLVAARAWLRQPGAGRKATEKLSRIDAAIRELGDAPKRWPVGDHAGVRERAIEGYRLLYRILPANRSADDAEIVVVLRVFGPYQDRTTL